jgi:hypothetical protein
MDKSKSNRLPWALAYAMAILFGVGSVLCLRASQACGHTQLGDAWAFGVLACVLFFGFCCMAAMDLVPRR